MLKKLLTDLRAGKLLVFSTRKNQLGEAIEEETLAFQSGVWFYSDLVCLSSSGLGLGTCGCDSHNPYREEEVSREEALRLLRRHIERRQNQTAKREAELAWLDQAIKDSQELS